MNHSAVQIISKTIIIEFNKNKKIGYKIRIDSEAFNKTNFQKLFKYPWGSSSAKAPSAVLGNNICDI